MQSTQPASIRTTVVVLGQGVRHRSSNPRRHPQAGAPPQARQPADPLGSARASSKAAPQVSAAQGKRSQLVVLS